MPLPKTFIITFAACLVAMLGARAGTACTGITLKAKDGAVVYGRTMEWGSFDLNSQVVIVPRDHKFTGMTPDKKPGVTWVGKYGFVGLDGLDYAVYLDGMNEKGLAVGGFYHPGFAEYQKYDPEKASECMGPGDVISYLLSTCATVEEAKAAMAKVRVTAVVAKVIGIAPPAHYIVTEPSGKAVVIEYHKGELKLFDAPLGVITNAPTYDWHEINLRNYLNLSAVALPSKKIEEMNFAPLGGGSGMIGLPGDFTPPSRFVRAVAFAKSARPTPTGEETVYELFRILDNFNVPLGAAEGEGDAKTKGMRSSTEWTTVWDTKNMVFYYHTQNNRRVRQVDLKKLDFAAKDRIRFPLDKEEKQDIEDVTPVNQVKAEKSGGVAHMIKAGGFQLEAFVYGDGPVSLIMAAGNGRPAAQLDDLAKAISANGIKVVTFNYRTLGASTGKFDNLTLHDWANDVWRVADGLGLKQVYLAGKTYGNRVVRTAAQDHPERVLGVILIGAGGEVHPDKETMEKYKRYLDPKISKEEWLKLQGELMYAPGNENLAKLDLAQGEFPELAAAQAKASDATPKDQWRLGGTAPMLILTGLQDLVAVPESALSIAKARPKAWLVALPNCGHNMLNERGDDIKRLMVEFILHTPSDAVKPATR